MNRNRTTRKIAMFTAAVLVLTFSAVQHSAAQKTQTPLITVSQMKGTWTATLSGVTGCGVTTLVTTFTLDATGNGTQTSAMEHTAGCGDTDQSGQSAQIQSFNADGSGFIALGCGTDCGFGFTIQVAKSKQLFNLGPQLVSGNFLAGVAIRK